MDVIIGPLRKLSKQNSYTFLHRTNAVYCVVCGDFKTCINNGTFGLFFFINATPLLTLIPSNRMLVGKQRVIEVLPKIHAISGTTRP